MFPEDNGIAGKITVSVAGKKIGTVESISTSTREVAPIYELGNRDARSFAPGIAFKEQYGTGVLNTKGIAGYRTSNPVYKDVLILPIEGFTEEQLINLLPGEDEFFDLKRLAQLNLGVFPFMSGTARVLDACVTDKGIIGNVSIISAV